MNWLITILAKIASVFLTEVFAQKKAADEETVIAEIKDAQDANDVRLRDLASVIGKLRNSKR